MGLLLLDRSNLHIKTEGEVLALYESGVRRGTVPIKLIDRCVVHGAQTQLDSGVLLKLAEAGVTTIFMSPRQHQRVALVLGQQHNDAAVRLAQAQKVLNEEHCQQWSKQLVQAKLKRQLRTLKLWLQARPDVRKAVLDACETIKTIQAELNQTEYTPGLHQLRGHEGAAARIYFSALAAVLPPALKFTGRNRQPPRDPANACLSLGYTLLHTQAVRACHIAGLDPMLGFYHRPAFGRESLASDLIEPLRSSVDEWVWQLFRQRNLREQHFTLDKGRCLMGKAGRAIFYECWEARQRTWQRCLRLQTQALARQLRQQGALWFSDAIEQEPSE
ncbi:MAG: CRISPR-associated endonuclease Cas1 [Burkholderiales bacterium]|jgi:CRISPR-associated protein Cas1|nr:CRISPR-associated endonuclease Cas1 [Burkholderiales bacterium]